MKRIRLGKTTVPGLFIVTALVVAACSSSTTGNGSHASGGTPVKGGTASIAVFSSGPNYVFPLFDANHFVTTNFTYLQALLYRPLYWFGQGNSQAINYRLSIGKPPVYSDGGKVVTIKLNPYRWSDGTPVTARDVEFWENLVVANKSSYGAYSPGNYPDNIASTKVIDPSTIQFTLTKAFDEDWFTFNELSFITPMPQHSWDRTSANGTVGDYDRTTSSAVAVYNFLAGQSTNLATYTTNPLWKVVDGPWQISAYTPSTGAASFVPNLGYSGPEKPHLSQFNEQVFATTTSEFNDLLGGTGPTVGFISSVEKPSQGALNRLGYTEANVYAFQIDYQALNFNNPKVGPLFKQLYIRQALQMLVNQKGLINSYYNGDAVPTCGPVPIQPTNPFADAHELSCPNSYNPSRAVNLLKAHGWHVVPGGISTCADPGTGSNQCGAGIAQGEQLKFTYLYPTGGISYQKAIAQQKSDAASAGVDYVLQGEPGQQVMAATVACTPTQPACNWEIGVAGWVFSPYPTGEVIFQTGGGYNIESYSDPTADQLIQASTQPGNPTQSIGAYQDYITDQVPALWQPVTFQLYEVSNKLGGATPPVNGAGAILPEEWYYTKK